jgi:hypothetical protein
MSNELEADPRSISSANTLGVPKADRYDVQGHNKVNDRYHDAVQGRLPLAVEVEIEIKRDGDRDRCKGGDKGGGGGGGGGGGEGGGEGGRGADSPSLQSYQRSGVPPLAHYRRRMPLVPCCLLHRS